jgi:hypothetical protein
MTHLACFSDFNSIPFCQCIGHFIEKQVNDRLSFRFGPVVWIFQRLDKFNLVHMANFFEILV